MRKYKEPTRDPFVVTVFLPETQAVALRYNCYSLSLVNPITPLMAATRSSGSIGLAKCN